MALLSRKPPQIGKQIGACPDHTAGSPCHKYSRPSASIEVNEPPAVETLIEIESLERAYSITHPFEQLLFCSQEPVSALTKGQTRTFIDASGFPAMQRGTIQTLMQLQLKGLLMRTIILYASRHHGNTKKLVDAIVEAHPEIDTLDVKTLGKNEYPNLHEYHLIGVATGIYYSEIDKDMARVLTNVLQPQDKVFGLMTYGGKNKWYGKDIDGICRMRQAIFMGVYGCVQKGHPTAEEIKGAVDFFDKIEDEYGDIIVEEYAKREKRLAYEKEHPAGGLVAGVKRTAKKIANKL